MTSSLVEWNSRRPQIRRFNHGYTSKPFCVRHHRPDSQIRCRNGFEWTMLSRIRRQPLATHFFQAHGLRGLRGIIVSGSPDSQREPVLRMADFATKWAGAVANE